MLIREDVAVRLSGCGQACRTGRLGRRFKKVCNVHSRGGMFCKALYQTCVALEQEAPGTGERNMRPRLASMLTAISNNGGLVCQLNVVVEHDYNSLFHP